MSRVFVYDTTLRDGSQGEGVNFSLQDKLLITRKLDELGVDFIEGGYPLSNPKDFEYFQEVRKLPLKHAKVAAFGMTRRKNAIAGRRHLPQGAARRRDAGRHHRRQDLGPARHARCSARRSEENLAMIADSVAHCRAAGREVFYDAEHFFDGFKANPEYALATLRAAESAGATVLILCDTNGGTLPEEIAAGVAAAQVGRASAARHPLPQRLRPGRGQHAGRRRRRGDAGAGHDQRHRRTLRQRRPGQRHRQPRR